MSILFNKIFNHSELVNNGYKNIVAQEIIDIGNINEIVIEVK